MFFVFSVDLTQESPRKKSKAEAPTPVTLGDSSSSSPPVQEQKKTLPAKVKDAEVVRAMYKLVYIFDQLCTKHNLTYWADGGTFIGAILYGGIIKHDDDLDCSMPEADLTKLVSSPELQKALCELGLKLVKFDYGYKLCWKNVGHPVKEINSDQYPTESTFPFVDLFAIAEDKKEEKEEFAPYTWPKTRKKWKYNHGTRSNLFPLRRMDFGFAKVKYFLCLFYLLCLSHLLHFSFRSMSHKQPISWTSGTLATGPK